MNFTCRICMHSSDGMAYKVREMFFGTREVFDYIQCPSCQCLQIVAIPGDMARFYPNGYYSFAAIKEASSVVGRLKESLKRVRNRSILFGHGVFGRLINRIKPVDLPLELLKRVGNLGPLSILDVGCGSGLLLHVLKEAGIDRILGIDPFLERDITYKNGLRIRKMSIADMKDECAQFDLVMFNHSFEHMSDPETVLKAAALILRDNGTVMIRMPTVDSYAWEHYREHWASLDAPRHLYLHSRTSLDMLADRAGLIVTDVVYDSDAFQFWASEQYLRDIPLVSELSFQYGLDKSIFSREQVSGFVRRAAGLNRENRGDTAAFFLKKSK